MTELLLPHHKIVSESIVSQTYHPYYKRVTELAVKYKQLITGENIDSLLHQFVKREDGVMFDQRKRITQIITPCISELIRQVFNKVGRTNNIVKKIQFDNTENDSERLVKINEVVSKYYGEDSLDEYMETRFTDISFTDPNAFIVTEFDIEIDANGKVEYLQTRPLEISSTEAINFKYENNQLKWLLIKLPSEYQGIKKIEIGNSYTIYLENFSIKYTQINSELLKDSVIGYINTTDANNNPVTFFKANKSLSFLVQEFEHKSKSVPAIRVGYKMDLVTDGKTCVNPFHGAMPYFMKTIKTVSEFDLTMCLHAFPKLFQYERKCQGAQNDSCSKGLNTEGSMCTKCKGSGLMIHTTAQDAVIIPMPKDATEMFDLSKMIHVESLDISLPDFQNKYINQLANQIFNTVFSSDTIQTPNVTTAATATEVIVTADNKNNTLYPYAKKYSSVYKKQVTISGYYLDMEDIIVIHQFPRDFKLKTLAELLSELKLANDSNAPGYVRRELSSDIAEQQFIDKPLELQKIKSKSIFYPFPDKTDMEIVFIISNNKTTLSNEILWANFDNIFAELEFDAEIKNEYFYDYAITKQKELITAKVEAMKLEISEASPTATIIE